MGPAGRCGALFVPFFGVPAATIPGVSRLARLTGADVEADTRRMNAYVEDCVRAAPAQYYWVHKRFKTRPPGEPRIY